MPAVTPGPDRSRLGTAVFAATLPAVLAAAACGYGPAARPVGPQPVPYADTLPIAEPGEQSVNDMAVVLQEAIAGEAERAVEIQEWVDGIPPALNVTRFDDVVPSAWYEPRQPLTPEAVARGPAGPDPASSGPLTVVDAKSEGVSPGFTVRDANGAMWIVKFDPPGWPGLSSGADVISSRLFWAAGYHVPRDVVMRFDPDRLVVDDDATLETATGERPMRPDDVASVLEGLPLGDDGRHRALASLFVPGTPKGEWRWENRRDDDPNDHYPHEHRRELRGVWVLAAWLNHVDLQARNTMDVWIEPTGYLRHYLIDFGTTLGSAGLFPLPPRAGREYAFDLWPFLARIPTLGLYRVGWEYESDEPIHPSLGLLATEAYDPEGWKPYWPNEAMNHLTPADGYWGAKRVAAFDEAHLRAVVDAAGYPDPVAADTLVDILLLRQERTVRHWYGEVTPVEDVKVEPRGSADVAITFRDLSMEEGFADPATTSYRWTFRHESVARRSEGTTAGRDGRQLIAVDWAEAGASQPGPGATGASPTGEEALATLEVVAVRSGVERPEAVITLRLDADGRYTVVGLAH